jgi:hypothetical protein
MTRAGHSDYPTTRIYINLAGERFREEADRLEQRLWGGAGTKSRYQVAALSSEEETKRPLCRTRRNRGGGTRTPGLRFWRPPLYQLSYAPRQSDSTVEVS